MTNKRPNILFVFPDQYRLQALGFRGEDPVHTPNLDAFAAESRVLTHAVSTRPVCSPYRAMLLTGQYPHKNGVVVNCNSNTSALGNYLKESTVCLSDVLAEAGYSQGYIGKWHLDPRTPTITPTRRDRAARAASSGTLSPRRAAAISSTSGTATAAATAISTRITGRPMPRCMSALSAGVVGEA